MWVVYCEGYCFRIILASSINIFVEKVHKANDIGLFINFISIAKFPRGNVNINVNKK